MIVSINYSSVMHRVGSQLLVVAMLLSFNVATAATQSGFIENMPVLKDKADLPGVKTWEKEGFNASAYTRFMIQPVTLFISPRSEYKGFDADEMKAISDGLRQTLTRAMEPEFPVVDESGAGVMVVRIAITNLQLKKKKKGLFSYTPIGFVADAATSSAGDHVNLLAATMEWELLDGVSGERLVVIVDTNVLQAGKDDGQSDWKAIKKALKDAVGRFRLRLESSLNR